MTTPTPPAGWYPDPTGKSGQMYWDGQAWQQNSTSPSASGLAPLPGTEEVVVPSQRQPGGAYAYKNPVLYAIGGIFFPPAVLYMMGGSRTTCLWMIGLWVAFWITVWLLGIGVVFMLALYIWSPLACYQEAVKQNQAQGFTS